MLPFFFILLRYHITEKAVCQRRFGEKRKVFSAHSARRGEKSALCIIFAPCGETIAVAETGKEECFL